MALRGLRVLEFAGLAPAPFCGMILSDFGASVVRVDRTGSAPSVDVLSRGKRSVCVDLKAAGGRRAVLDLCAHHDVLIEPYRPGVMERFGLGPAAVAAVNPRLIYARLTGFGQSGPLAARAGHDINFLAVSGVLSALGRHHENPYAPVNLLADFAGGGLMCAFGILAAVIERERSGRGQVIDAAMVEGAAYVGSWLWASRGLDFVWPESWQRGRNWLDGGAAFYDTYETADGRYMSLGAIEPGFYAQFAAAVGLPPDTQFDTNVTEVRLRIAERFRERTQAEWCRVFAESDACVFPVVPLDEAADHPHNAARRSFMRVPAPGGAGEAGGGEEHVVPRPAPVLERTPAEGPAAMEAPDRLRPPAVGEHTVEVMRDVAGYTQERIDELVREGALQQQTPAAKL